MGSRQRRRALALPLALILYLLPFALPAQERAVSWRDVWNLRFRKTDEELFSETEHSFYVEIAGVSPDRVQVTVNSLPQNVSFLSAKKESVTIKRSSGKSISGTRITLWMEFAKSGFYQIDPVDVVIDKGFYRIPVGTVQVFENPRLIRPELLLSFEGKDPRRTGVAVVQGECLVFTVSVRGAQQVKGVHWRLPEDSVFRCTDRYFLHEEISPLSKELIPLARFQWQPLRVGTHSFPQIFVDALCFDGSYTRESPAPFSVTVSPVPAQENSPDVSDTTESFVKQAFTPSDKETAGTPLKETGLDEASLVRAKRGRVRLFCTLVCATLLCLCACVLLASLCRKRKAAVALSAAAVFAVCAALAVRGTFACQAVVLRGQLYPIPEKDQSPDVTLPSGSVVFVERIVDDWALIRYEQERGWLATSNIHVITAHNR